MKRTIALLLALLLLASLCACGKKEVEATQTGKAAENSPVEAADPAPEAAETPNPFAGLDDEYEIRLPRYSIDYHYSSLLESKYSYTDVVYDEQGRIISWVEKYNDRGGTKVTREFDEEGRLVLYVDADPSYGYSVVYEYDDEGRLVFSKETDAKDPSDYTERTYTYDENGLMTGEYVHSTGYWGDSSYEYSYEFDELGRISMESTASDEDYVTNHYYIYDTANRTLYDNSETIDEGIHKSSYETKYTYNMYGFPVFAFVDNYFDYKGDTVTWTHETEYAVTGYETVSSEEEEMLRGASEWENYEECDCMPRAETVLSGLGEPKYSGGGYYCLIPDGIDDEPLYNVYGVMQGILNGGITSPVDISACSAQDTANRYLWCYEAVLTQVLGMESVEVENYLSIRKNGREIARINVFLEGGEAYLAVCLMGPFSGSDAPAGKGSGNNYGGNNGNGNQYGGGKGVNSANTGNANNSGCKYTYPDGSVCGAVCSSGMTLCKQHFDELNSIYQDITGKN